MLMIELIRYLEEEIPLQILSMIKSWWKILCDDDGATG